MGGGGGGYLLVIPRRDVRSFRTSLQVNKLLKN